MNWRDNKGYIEIPAGVTALVREANINNCWIYHNKTRKYYTANEFMVLWPKIFNTDRHHPNEKEFKLKMPEAALKQRAEWVSIASKELDDILLKWDEFKKYLDEKNKMLGKQTR